MVRQTDLILTSQVIAADQTRYVHFLNLSTSQLHPYMRECYSKNNENMEKIRGSLQSNFKKYSNIQWNLTVTKLYIRREVSELDPGFLLIFVMLFLLLQKHEMIFRVDYTNWEEKVNM